ncbi:MULTISPECIES: polyprenyl synthetase family protein [unclassified Brevibacterium]|uniref:polyprenyl synthetase family protein n=1 Tax=unclassified Brevibacterium TaxID=2614124 RepID=UPI00363F113E
MDTTSATADTRARDRISAALSEFFTARTERARLYGDDFASLWEVARDRVTGGKLVRPLLFLDMLGAFAPMTCDHPQIVEDPFTRVALAETDDPVTAEAATAVALACELLHYALLLHDDVIDGDRQRRGRPNLIGALQAGRDAPGAGHWASTGAILMGDMLLAAVHHIIGTLEVTGDKRSALFSLLDHALIESSAGEFLDVGLADGVIPAAPDTVLAMSSFKTSAYSFTFPIVAAAILTDRPPLLQTQLRPIGAHLGLGFQLHDDLLSAFGTPESHGKDAYSDFREGKITALVAHAQGTEAWGRVAGIFGDPQLTHAGARDIQQALADSGALAEVESLIAAQRRSFAEAIDCSDLPGHATAVLTDIAARLDGRTV